MTRKHDHRTFVHGEIGPKSLGTSYGLMAVPRVKMADPTFIRAASGELERVLEFIEKYYAFDGIWFRGPEIKGGLERLLRDSSVGGVWLVRLDGEDVGYVIFTFGYDLEFGGPLATITDLYILDRYRRLGLGGKILSFVERTCRELGIEALELQVERKNVAAQAFYGKMGFEPLDRIPLIKRLNVRSEGDSETQG